MTWPSGNGEMARCIRDHDWSATPLGPIETRPPPLRAVIDLILSAATPIGLYCGPDLVRVFNDPWRRLTDAKHPGAPDRPAREVLAEIRGEIGPMLAGVLAGRSAAQVQDRRLPLDRDGRVEEAWFSFGLDPIRLADGSVGGILNIATATTGRILTDRRRAEAERALRDSEERQRLTVELVPAMLWWCEAEGGNSAINHRWRSYTGQDRIDVQDTAGSTQSGPTTSRQPARPPRTPSRPAIRSSASSASAGRAAPIAGIWCGKCRTAAWTGTSSAGSARPSTSRICANCRSASRSWSPSFSNGPAASWGCSGPDRQNHGALARVQDLLSRHAEGERVTSDELLRMELTALNGRPDRLTLAGPTGGERSRGCMSTGASAT